MATTEPTPLFRYASGVLKDLLEDLCSQLEGAVDAQDVEFVHRSRVASRRVRAALDIFADCFPRKRHKAWTKGVKRITKAFGAARDLDVQIGFLAQYMQDHPEATALQRLMTSLQESRVKAQPDIVQAVQRFKEDCILDDILKCLGASPLLPEEMREVRVAALAHAMDRMEAMVALEIYVRVQDACLEHHQMRIAGKKLRYALEIFSPAFDDALRPNIKLMKEMQDVLGEMHDCDVWACLLKEGRYRSKAAQGLRMERAAHRKELYSIFVEMWNGLRHVHFLEMERTMRTMLNGKAGKMEVLHQRIGLISDIHGNLPALEAVLADAKEQGVEAFLNTGDNTGLGPFGPEVIRKMATERVISIRGNVDDEIIDIATGRVKMKRPSNGRERAVFYAAKDLDKSSLELLQRFPAELRLKRGGKSVLITHASPAARDEKINDLMPEERLKELAALAKAKVVVFGHSHTFFDREVDGVRFVNPGSVGRQVDGDPRASYAIWDTESGTVEHRRVAYRLHEVMVKIAEKDWPADMALVHIWALSSDAEEKSVQLSRDACLAKCEEVALGYGQFDAHSVAVRENARVLFSALKELHGLEDEDLLLLECAATMHDVGWAWGGKGHHLSSFDLIAMSAALPMGSEARLKVAIMARYHRGALPKMEHGLLSLISKKDAEKVERSIALLRIADGLDYGHAQKAIITSVSMSKSKVTVELSDKAGCFGEVEASLRKADMFQLVFDRELEFK